MDMLIKLYGQPPLGAVAESLNSRGIIVRPAMACERSRLLEWVRGQFGERWADECAVAFGRQPIGCFMAVSDDRPVGFCCVESTFPNFIGPIGTDENWRRQGIGRALVLTALRQLREQGYAYAVAGNVGVPEFFSHTCGATEIAGSTPGPYPPRFTSHGN